MTRAGNLSRTDIISTGMAILDSFGLADLSMRRIATSLGVQPGALYWYFDNKQSLLAALADEVLAGLDTPSNLRTPGLRAWAHALRDRLLAHRDGAELVSSVLALRLLSTSPVRQLAQVLTDSGRPADRAGGAAALLVHFVLGHTLDQQGHAQAVELGVIADDEDTGQRFDIGLDLILEAFARA